MDSSPQGQPSDQPAQSPVALYLRLFLLAAALWTLTLAASLIWNLHNARQQIMDQAYAEARANLNKDITFRRWGTKHGGVYVPITPSQQSIPWLSHVPGRDVTTTDGKKLTLLNPATMLRQMMDDYHEAYGIRGRITGLKYLNPGNAPDTWETQQLEAFTRGEKKETWEIADLDGAPHLRYLRAMFMEPGCDKCHAVLGYKTGDMRGATGLNLPLAPYYRQIETIRRNLSLSHGAIWLLGLAGLGWAGGLARQRDLARQAREAAYRAKIEVERKAQEEIHRLSQRNQILLDAAGEGIFGVDHLGLITFINPAALTMLGYTREEALGANAHALFHHSRPDGSVCPEELCPLRMSRSDGIRREVEESFIRKNGEFFTVRLVITPLIDEQRLIGDEVIFEDITERKRAILALQESEARLRSIIEASPVPYALNDDRHNIVMLNPAFVGAFGYTLDDIPTLSAWWQCAYPDPDYRRWVMEEWSARLDESRAQGTRFQPFELDIRCKDGARRSVEASAAPLGNGSSGVHLVILIDITERKKNEERLQKLSLAVEQSPESIVITDLDARIEYVNEAFVRNSGFSSAELLGQNPRLLQSGRTPPERYREMWNALTQGHSWKGEFVNKRKDGSEYIESIIVSPVCSAAGRMTHYVAIKQDITEKKQAEAELKHLNETLEQRVIEETANNREKDKLLIQQSHLAAMGDTIHNIAHQWRQPINALNLLLYNIKDAYEFDELSKEFLNEEVEAGSRIIHNLSATIDDFRNFFKPGGEKCVFSINQAVDNACHLMAATLSSHAILVQFKADAELYAFGYPNEYAQVVLNLLSNAKDALVRRNIAKPRIELELTDRQGNAELLLFDNAGGIPAENLPRIFDPYFTTKEKGGLGLYMSKLIIENNMEGVISAANYRDGAAFRISCASLSHSPVARS